LRDRVAHGEVLDERFNHGTADLRRGGDAAVAAEDTLVVADLGQERTMNAARTPRERRMYVDKE